MFCPAVTDQAVGLQNGGRIAELDAHDIVGRGAADLLDQPESAARAMPAHRAAGGGMPAFPARQ